MITLNYTSLQVSEGIELPELDFIPSEIHVNLYLSSEDKLGENVLVPVGLAVEKYKIDTEKVFIDTEDELSKELYSRIKIIIK